MILEHQAVLDDHAFCGLILFDLMYFCTDVGGLNFAMKLFVCFVGGPCADTCQCVFTMPGCQKILIDDCIFLFCMGISWISEQSAEMPASRS